MLDRFETFATTVALMNRCVQRIKAREMDALRLKGTHVMCLYCLGKRQEGMTASQLCKACGEDKAAISRTVAELAKRGHVSLPQETDKRAYRAYIRLTDKGKETLAYINERVARALDAVGEVLDEKQREDFYQSMTKIAERLRRYTEELTPET